MTGTVKRQAACGRLAPVGAGLLAIPAGTNDREHARAGTSTAGTLQPEARP